MKSVHCTSFLTVQLSVWLVAGSIQYKSNDTCNIDYQKYIMKYILLIFTSRLVMTLFLWGAGGLTVEHKNSQINRQWLNAFIVWEGTGANSSAGSDIQGTRVPYITCCTAKNNSYVFVTVCTCWHFLPGLQARSWNNGLDSRVWLKQLILLFFFFERKQLILLPCHIMKV
jgi:hypothetical protein